LEAATVALRARLSDDSVSAHGLWGPFSSGQATVYRWVYSYPAWRHATLEHWRDEGEWAFEEELVVAMEASKVARLLLKGYGPASDWFSADPIDGDAYAEALVRLVSRLGGVEDQRDRYLQINPWLSALRREGEG
jgi:hypothetical protein